MKKLTAMTILTFKEEIRSKMLYVCIVLVPIVAGVSKLFTSITPGSEKAFVLDVSIGVINLLAILSVIVGTSDIIYREVRRKTIYTLKTNPIGSFHIVLGKFLGMGLSIGLALTLMNILFVGMFLLFFRSIPEGLLVTLGMGYIKIFMLIALGVLGSTSLSMITNVLWCFFLYLVGNMTHQVQQIAERSVQALTKRLIQGLAIVIPDFERLKTIEYVIVETQIPSEKIWPNVIYGSVYIVAVILFAVLLYRHNSRKMDL